MAPLVVRVGAYPHRVEQTVAWERAALTAAGVDYRFVETATPSEQLAAVAEADAIIAGGLTWDAALLGQLSRCRLLVSGSVGLDRVDVAAATAHGIMVCNMPDLCTDEVADHAMALLLACVRKVVRLHRRLTDGTWDRVLLEPMPRLRGKRLGLIGFGRIGQATAERARGFGLIVQAHDPVVAPAVAAAAGVSLLPLDDLLSTSDFVSIHVPLMATTTGLIGAAELARLQPHAMLINTSRGRIIDEPALIAALRASQLAGAGLDVFAEEPTPADNPLLTMEQVVVTPHTSGFSDEVVDLIPRLAVAEVLAVLGGGEPRAIAWANRSARPWPARQRRLQW
jgi:D-3-phosphoglycerate dehydrogenase